MVGAGDRFSFVFPPNRQLAEPYETMWVNRHLIDEESSDLEIYWARNTTDPVLGLDPAVADQRARRPAALRLPRAHP